MNQSDSRRRSPGLVLLALLSATAIAASACGQSSSSGSAGASASQSAAASGTAAASEEPSGSAGEPSGSASAPSGSAATGTADISGALLVGTKMGCEPLPCVPEGEGVADEIGYTRNNLFAEQYPDVQVSFTEADFEAQTFLTAVAAGEPPDAVRMDRAIVGTYVAEGALQPLDECISKFGIDMSQYREPAVAGVTIEGQVYGIPEFYDSRIILINNSAVEDAGLTPEDIDTSDWERLAEINEQLMAKEGDQITRIGFDPKLPEFLPLWAKANGVDIVSPDGLTSQLDDPKVAEALQFAASLILAHGPGPAFKDFRDTGPGGSDFFGPDNQFAADTLGAMPMEQWYLNVLANNTPDEEISFTTFKDRQGNDISFSGGSAWVIPVGAKNPDAACEFMRVVTHADSWVAAAETRAEMRAADGEAFTGVYTGNKAADERIFGDLVTEETAGAYYEGVQLVLETSDIAFSMPPIPAAEEFLTIWQNAVLSVINNGADPTEALAQADQEAQDAIDNAAP